MVRLTEMEKQNLVQLIQSDEPIPQEYRFKLFEDSKDLELLWFEKTSQVTNTVLPFQIIEQIDEPRSEKPKKNEHVKKDLFDTDERGRQLKGWTNKLIWGDNKLVLSSLKNGPLRQEIEDQGGLKLIYIDPPFDIGADFSIEVEVGADSFVKNPSVLEEFAYRDTWGRGKDSYLSMIYERLLLMRDLLSDDGSIYVHCGIQVNHLMREVMNEIFGQNNFVSEIIWAYGSPSGGRAAGTKLVKIHEYIIHFAKNYENRIENKIHLPYTQKYIDEWFRCFDEDGRRYQKRMRGRKSDGSINWEKQYLDESKGVPASTVWNDIKQVYADPRAYKENQSEHSEILKYPTQKPEQLIERIIEASTNSGDLIADFFVGSGTTAAAAEKLNRKWIVGDIGKFAIHTTRKRMIKVQRTLKSDGNDYRAFEILNLGRYERQHYIGVNPNLNSEEQQKQLASKEKDFLNLILQAYGAESVKGFNTLHGKHDNRFVFVGPINMPLTRKAIESIVEECQKNEITKVDILSFEFELGIFPKTIEDAKGKGIDIVPKYIPSSVFDKHAIEKDQVVFHDIAFIEAKAKIDGNKVAVELTDFSVYFSQGSVENVENSIKKGRSKIIIDKGQIVKINKSKEGIIERETLTEKWTDWIDYWSVDFDFENKKELVRIKNVDTGEWEDRWTGDYVFENEWQSFRTKADREVELVSAGYDCAKGRRKIAIKVVDILGNDTMKILTVKI